MTEREVFIAALQKEDPAQRQAYLDEACALMPELRRQVEHLLRLHQGAGSFLEEPAACPPATGAFQEATEQASSGEVPGALVGPYKLLERVGEGGMGTVWMAQQQDPVKRLVAVKLIKAGMDSKQVIARFEAERQALALMDHPHIARVLDAGATSAGRPYFVMDLVRGVPITSYCDEHHLTPRQRLELFVPVCEAIQHAHQKGVIHRDVKPSNVLIGLYDGRPVPKVIDFGVAKAAGQALTDKTLVTGFGAIVGTLEYVSPEQAELNNLDVDTRSDVYALGVLLYELLTGSTPFSRKGSEKGGVLEMLRVIREQEPTSPSTKLSTAEGLPTLAANRGMEPAKLARLLRGELDWIVLKALEKDRNRRYDTASAFAADVQRHLADEPVLACPPSVSYRLRKFVRRNKGPVLAATLVALALVAGIVGTTAGLVQAEKARKKAVAAHEAEAEQLQTAEEERAVAQAVNDFVQKDLLDQADLGNQPGGAGVGPRDPDVKVRALLDRAAGTIESRFTKQPRVEAAIRLTIANAYRAVGCDKEGQLHAERSVELRTALLGADHRDTLASKTALAWLYADQGLLGRAAALCREVMQAQAATLGPDHPDTLASKYQLAIVHSLQFEFDRAEPLFREVAQKREEQLGTHDPATLWSKNALAWVCGQRGDGGLAERLLTELVEGSASKVGEDHPAILAANTNLAWAYAAQGKFGQAESHLQKVLRQWEALQRPNHPITLEVKYFLARLYAIQRKYAEAARTMEEVIEANKASQGEDHPSTLAYATGLAVVYCDWGKRDRTLPLLEQTLARLDERPLAGLYLTASTRIDLSRAYLAAKMPEKAVRVGEQTLALLEGQLGPDDVRTLAVLDFLARTLLEVNQANKALPLVRELLDRQRKRLGAGSEPFANLLTSICLDLLKHEHFPEAEQHLRECLAIREKKEPDAWTTFNTKSMLGAALLGQKKYADAEPLLRAGYEGMKQREARIPPQGKPRLTEALERLVRVCDALDKADEAAKWRSELEKAKEKP